jgi:hypothetical protein
MKDSDTARITKRAKRTAAPRCEPSRGSDDQRLVDAMKSNWQGIDAAVRVFEHSVCANPRRESHYFGICMARILEIIPWAERADVVLIIGLWGKIAASRTGDTSRALPLWKAL